MKKNFNDMSSAEIAEDYVNTLLKLQKLDRRILLLMSILWVYVLSSKEAWIVNNVVTVILIVTGFYHFKESIGSRKGRQYRKQFSAILNEDVNPQKYIEVLDELEERYPEGWDRIFLRTEQGRAY